ncbi:lipopolysaccharide heptosyltransferase [Ameyamaea chiangmaiensis NBRC 103196]|uniref:Glycosyltransferase family 9 protein n=1 Tax=Ameyamaea chiangmaiensis TaxID=442969 RepID=A0A850PAL7_9PROT|nr:glycosyltransferase family 9 protein [Ameyamaea chiangmaiensis]MBS4074257.1 glycosyltransferase family 9 protein [Ameyamaea chiangmaiensis]NVN41567.1 glycosyltransferase family 9 protein [Ameyamaea chiangmaiensis]GBQ71402.1 lipopolysaccharide heptosyltransferase [Ameyamaea chiangmaiensis NBRC 103196]
MRILFITATRLGDAVLSTGLLDHLIRVHPDARFTIACGPVAAGLFEHMPRRDRTIVVRKRRLDRHWFDLWRACVGTRWDLVVDLRGSAIGFALWARRRVVMRGGRRPGLRIGHLGAALGLLPPPSPVVWTSPAERAAAVLCLPDGALWIGIGPTANWDGKVWPAARFVALFRAIVAVWPQARPVVLRGPGVTEASIAAPVIEALRGDGVVDSGGDLTLPAVAALLGRCAVFVGNDSGLMHLSAAAGTATLGLFGPSRVSEYAPTGRLARFVTAPGPEGMAPIAGLSVETAATAALAILREDQAHRDAQCPGTGGSTGP